VLPNHEVNADVVGTKTYSDIVYVGNTFTYYVDKYEVSTDSKPEAETLLKKGDELVFTIISEPELNYSEPEEAFLGIAGPKIVSISLNGYVFDSIDDFLLMPYIIVDAIVVPVCSQQIEAEGCTNFMEMMEDMFDDPGEGYSVITNNITENYYELEYTFEITQMSGYVHRKYDIETGLVLLSHEDVDLFAIENPDELIASSDILLIHEEEKTRTTSFPIYSLFLLLPVIVLVNKIRRAIILESSE
jgi:hypothetical protein